jgi:hypothetical protein
MLRTFRGISSHTKNVITMAIKTSATALVTNHSYAENNQ